MIRCKKEGVEWLQFELLTDLPHLKHGCFLRLDMSTARGVANRSKAKEILGIPTLAFTSQYHGKEVQEVLPDTVDEVRKCDALATSAPDIGLLIRHADCQAAIFYDPMHHAIANVHSGWRGSVQNIYAETVSFMQTRYGSTPADLLVGISPSLGPDKGEFIHFRKELPEHFRQFQVKPNYFDFWEISRWQLEQCGVLPSHIEIAGMCTYSTPEECHSYRRNKATERLGTIVSLC